MMMSRTVRLLGLFLSLLGRASPFMVGQSSGRKRPATGGDGGRKRGCATASMTTMMFGPFDAAATTITLADGGEWRQYVPLVTSGLVLADMLAGAVTGNSVANSISASMQQSVTDKEAAEEEAARAARGIVRPSDAATSAETAGDASSKKEFTKARVDTDGMREDALKRAEMAMLAVELRDERRGFAKGSVEDLKRKLDRELGDMK
jgi:hypothetical protein